MNTSYENPVIFIGGSQRSGTTLIQTWLCNATDRLPVLPEAHIICDQITSFRNAQKLWNKSRYYFASKEAMTGYYRDLIADLIMRTAGSADRPRGVVLKDPHFSRVMPEIRTLIETAKIICCVRDPRDVVCSKLEAKEREKHRRLRVYERYSIIRETAESYRKAYERIDAVPCDIHIVHYEQFVQQPWNVTVELAHALDMPVLNTDVESFAWLDAADRHQSAWVTELEGSAPSSREVGKFAERLRGNELARIEWTCRSAMRTFGYAETERARKWKRAMRLARRWGI